MPVEVTPGGNCNISRSFRDNLTLPGVFAPFRNSESNGMWRMTGQALSARAYRRTRTRGAPRDRTWQIFIATSHHLPKSRNEGAECVSMTWWALDLSDIARMLYDAVHTKK